MAAAVPAAGWYWFGFWASKLIGIASEATNMEHLNSVSSRCGITAIGLQFVIAWLLRPTMAAPHPEGPPVVRFLVAPESPFLRSQKYFVRLATSFGATIVLALILLIACLLEPRRFGWLLNWLDF